ERVRNVLICEVADRALAVKQLVHVADRFHRAPPGGKRRHVAGSGSGASRVSPQSYRKLLVLWRRAGDSNSHGPCGPVDFKSTALPVEASPPGLIYQSLTIHQPQRPPAFRVEAARVSSL